MSKSDNPYGSNGKMCYENWTRMLEEIQRRQSYGENFDVDAAVKQLIQTIEDDKQKAYRRIGNYKKVIIAGVIIIVLLFVIPNVTGNFGSYMLFMLFAGIGAIYFGNSMKNDEYGIFTAAKEFQDKYL